MYMSVEPVLREKTPPPGYTKKRIKIQKKPLFIDIDRTYRYTHAIGGRI
jgi:hypothetical protein